MAKYVTEASLVKLDIGLWDLLYVAAHIYGSFWLTGSLQIKGSLLNNAIGTGLEISSLNVTHWCCLNIDFMFRK